MTPVTVGLQDGDEAIALRLAQEIAMGLHDINAILEHHAVSGETWDRLSETPYFQGLLRSAIIEWESSLNTHERTKLKASAMIEQWLLRANKDLHNTDQPLPARNELAKIVKSIAGMDQRGPGEGVAGERFSVTINLGGDSKLSFTKQVTPKVIEGEITHQETL